MICMNTNKNPQKNFHPDRIGSYFQAEWRVLILVTLSGLFYNIGLLATPWFEGQLAQCLSDILRGSKNASRMKILVSSYFAVVLAVQSARFLKRFYVRRFSNNINRRMKGVLYANLLRQRGTSLKNENAGNIMTKAISDVDDCAEGMRKFTTELFDTGVVLIGYVIMLLIYEWRLALISLLFTPISYICAAYMKKPIQRAGASLKKAAAAMDSAILDWAENAMTYRIYGCEDIRTGCYEDNLKDYERAAIKSNVWQSALPPLYLAISGMGVIFILWYGAKNVAGDGWTHWDIAAFTTFLSCFTKMTVKSSKAAKLFNSVQKASISWKRIRPLMKQPAPLEALKAEDPDTLTIKELSFSYGEQPIFSGLSLTAQPGDMIGVTGPIAGGKSTLGRVFLCEAPYKGSIRFGNRELSDLSMREAAGLLGYLGHDTELFADTIKNNVCCGLDMDPLPYLSLSALKDEVLAMENGIKTVLGNNGMRLSGGQAQRLALARTLAHPRPIMVLDDPFSALDRKTEDIIFEKLKDYADDKIVFLISHRLYHFPQMKKIIFMDDGKAIVGSHDELMIAVPAYRHLYENQIGGEHSENE